MTNYTREKAMETKKLQNDWTRAKEYMGTEGMLEELEKWLSDEKMREIIDYIDSQHDIFEV